MSNLEVVQELYSAFGDRDRERILAVMDPQIRWVQNEGFPGGGEHVGAEFVLDEVLGVFPRDWDGWQAAVSRWLEAGDAVVALGQYQGTYKKTGRAMSAGFAHVYWVRDGRIVRFEQYTDTTMVLGAMGE